MTTSKLSPQDKEALHNAAHVHSRGHLVTVEQAKRLGLDYKADADTIAKEAQALLAELDR